ncbi:hypothetical protein ACJIZ3_004399 [Penstemon smallii]|uniref:Uncharacterized protein n=1 Tax=Penstemon smallii TaxID=265156 RepID=A0ABD3S1X4_9LAMI
MEGNSSAETNNSSERPRTSTCQTFFPGGYHCPNCTAGTQWAL